MKNLLKTAVCVSLICLNGCQTETSDEDTQLLAEGEGIVIDDAWARPAGEGRISAAYFHIINYDDESDRLLSITSDVAHMAQIHESFEQEGGMVGMREAGEMEIVARSTVHFQPGGLHVMLMQLTRDLEEGDEFDLTLHFEKLGEIKVTVPVSLHR